MKQLPLFGAPPAPFTLESSPDLIVICSRCHRQIIAQRRTASGTIMSEFVGAHGECFGCAEAKRKARKRPIAGG